MARTPSTMLPLGTPAPDFALPDPDGKVVSVTDFSAAPALLVAFLSNHCPFVKHVADGLGELARDLQADGVAVVGISANDVANYPDDRPEMMAKMAERTAGPSPTSTTRPRRWPRPTGPPARPTSSSSTRQRQLVYRGQMDGARPGNGVPVDGADLRAAVDAVLAGRPVADDQRPSMGCNIKWKPGNEPEYF